MQPKTPPAPSRMLISSAQQNLSPLKSLCPLEILPPELCLAILDTLNTISLRTLIRASPKYLALYLAHQPSILRNQLHNLLGPAVVDAVVAVGTSGVWPLDEVNAYLNSPYPNSWRAYQPNLSASQFQRILHNQTEHIEPFVREYANSALGNLAHFKGGWDAFDWAPESVRGERWPARLVVQVISDAEKMRITRAIYRLLLLHRIAPSPLQPNLPRLSCEGQKALKRRFAPWEWEGICSILEYGLKVRMNPLLRTGYKGRCCADRWDPREFGNGCGNFLLGETHGLKNGLEGVEEAPVAWGWTDGTIFSPAPTPMADDWSLIWGSIGYVFWDDERMLQWARKVGRPEMAKMGFTVGSLEGVPDDTTSG